MDLKKIVFGATALLVMVSCGNKNSNPFGGGDTSPKEYPTAVLQEQSVELESVYPVTIKGQEDIEIRPRIDGFIDAIYVDEGSVVKKGQTLFKINSPQAAQAVNTAKAAVSSAEAQVQTAKLNVDRIRPLAEKGIVSQVQLDTYMNAYTSALATKAQADATLTNANATMSWTNVSSPVDGVVGSIPFRLGSLVNNGNVLTTVSSTSNVFANFSLNEKELVTFLANLEGKTQAEKIKNLPEISLRMADGTLYSEKGKIKTITGQVNVTTGSANFRADFPNPHGILRSGFSGNISIPKHIEKAILIPQVATFTKQNKHLTYKVVNDSIAIQTLISVVPTPDGKSYVVEDGLSVGDRIITNGIATLSDSARVIVKK
ncbi:efflux RND transporter periplasmic adaptor subunit [Dysgonomonas sp. BGC7]|uniref:efflux RND transporter periplasmic adaptor subunit n=1 Tax=Dysgonomonas sp. BGC7 TaxID=1658008 RepID=UPI00067FE003|nr:efflux RND transporter periplasmic adaptor subunit [Dysgonomonas sp. BGC7]MBD8388500.1 efflux RND transporter periplasmic adaptor subunit [Dysgonomonas sp. BGC7]